jgi:signal peptidase I
MYENCLALASLRREDMDMKSKLKSTLLAQATELALPLALVFFSTTAIAQPFYVPSGSMEPTLQIGDALLASKFPYGYSRYSLPLAIGPKSDSRLLGRLPKRGDVVVFRLPRDPKFVYVKRVIGLPGDHIQMVAGRLTINDRIVPLIADGTGRVESTADGSWSDIARFTETLPNGVEHTIFKKRWNGTLDNTPVFAVPANHIFVMGDNRDDSTDSRVSPQDDGVGFVPVENLLGRVEFTLASYDFLNAHGPESWPSLLRLDRFFKSI